MIPTMLLFGLVFGRWWRGTILFGAVLWTAWLLVDGTIDLHLPTIAITAGLGAANTAVGAALNRAAVAGWSALRGR